jgi:hypothetical protein
MYLKLCIKLDKVSSPVFDPVADFLVGILFTWDFKTHLKKG